MEEKEDVGAVEAICFLLIMVICTPLGWVGMWLLAALTRSIQ
jgi:hypothetical protein